MTPLGILFVRNRGVNEVKITQEMCRLFVGPKVVLFFVLLLVGPTLINSKNLTHETSHSLFFIYWARLSHVFLGIIWLTDLGSNFFFLYF